jgi:hypothetical protein
MVINPRVPSILPFAPIYHPFCLPHLHLLLRGVRRGVRTDGSKGQVRSIHPLRRYRTVSTDPPPLRSPACPFPPAYGPSFHPAYRTAGVLRGVWAGRRTEGSGLLTFSFGERGSRSGLTVRTPTVRTAPYGWLDGRMEYGPYGHAHRTPAFLPSSHPSPRLRTGGRAGRREGPEPSVHLPAQPFGPAVRMGRMARTAGWLKGPGEYGGVGEGGRGKWSTGE